jgi:hypothetical protein
LWLLFDLVLLVVVALWVVPVEREGQSVP